MGLGNPGRKYARTRHNVGFLVLDRIAAGEGFDFRRRRFGGLYVIESTGDRRVIWIKPQSYVNLSGRVVRQFAVFYRVAPESLLVVLDDMALPPGKIRLRRKGSSGGHRGLKSIIQELGTEEFPRLRVGIGPSITEDSIGHVLGKFSPTEWELMDEALSRAVSAVEFWLSAGIDECMNRYNA